MLPELYDEPFADSSQIPTYLVSRLARNQVTVALSGDGGDELFGGYERHRLLGRLSWAQGSFPTPLLQLAGQALRRTPPAFWDCLSRGVPTRTLPASLRHRTGPRMKKLGRFLMSDSPKTGYESLTSLDYGRNHLVLGCGDQTRSRAGDLLYSDSSFSPTDRAMLVDLLTYLPDDVLAKVDRASMAVSLELRCPFLDPDLFRFAWGLRGGRLEGNSDGKWALRESLRDVLPGRLINRPKQGFGVPVGDWVRGPLRSWAEDLLAPGPLAEQGYLDHTLVARRWKDHLSGRGDFTEEIWAILMFQAWLHEAGE
jgi:asparagine synthase (glutamine-hydrolysing)